MNDQIGLGKLGRAAGQSNSFNDFEVALNKSRQDMDYGDL